MKQFWDDRFSGQEYVYGNEPNVFLKEKLTNLPTGVILFPCEGEGRNAVYAASLGWQVHAFDYSVSGRNKALMLANHQDVPLEYKVFSVEKAAYPENSFDVIALVYAHLEPELRHIFHQKCISWLKPGGRIILEAFHPNQLNLDRTSGGPKNPDMLYTEEMLNYDFMGLNAELMQSMHTDLNEGAFHQGGAEVIRYVGVKPSL